MRGFTDFLAIDIENAAPAKMVNKMGCKARGITETRTYRYLGIVFKMEKRLTATAKTARLVASPKEEYIDLLTFNIETYCQEVTGNGLKGVSRVVIVNDKNKGQRVFDTQIMLINPV